MAATQTTEPQAPVSPRDQAGMDWWNGLELVARHYWTRKAARVLGHNASASDAYSVYLASNPKEANALSCEG